MPHPGQMLGDRYRLDDRIAAGGMGEVWQATDTVLGRDVAVKTLHAGRAGDPGFQNRFRHEARAMAILHHPGVADVYDYGQTGDGADAYIVMARVQGQPLNQRIAERGRLDPVETMSIVAQAGRALNAAHQAGIVHRDVKPSNLIVQPDGAVVLVDFGVARSAESAALTGAKEVVGTALYIAPEQVSKRTTGPPADVYALGAVAYHCLSGHPPFLGPNPIAVALQHLQDDPPELPPEVPEPVRILVATAMAKDPAQRFSSAAGLADAADAARQVLSGPSDSTAALSATGLAATTPDLAAPNLPAPDLAAPNRAASDLAASDLAASDLAASDLAASDPAAPNPAAPNPAAPNPAASTRAASNLAAASGAATVPVPGPRTTVPPGEADPSPPAKRRRLLLLVLASVLLALAAIVAVLAFANPGGFLPGSPGATPSPSAPASPSAKSRSAAPPPTTQKSHRPTATTRATTTAPAGGNATRTTTPTPSHTPTATATTTTTAPTQTTTAAATQTTAAAGPTP